jgi:hypothetical protein
VSSTATSIELVWDPAYDDGGSPIKNYQLFMDEVEGTGIPNVENWINVYTGSALTYTVPSAQLTPKAKYNFKVTAISEQALVSLDSKIATFIAASKPGIITFPASPFTEITKTTLLLTWTQPTLTANDIPILRYRVYWNEGVRASG